jgi:hypothetical protein
MQDLDPHVFEDLKADAKKKTGQKSGPSEADQQAHRTWAMIARKAAQIDQSLASAKTLATMVQTFGRRTPGASVRTVKW